MRQRKNAERARPAAAPSRAKILCVRPSISPNSKMLPFLKALGDEWIQALAFHCDVETIDRDFDLLEVYERVKPDLILFDTVTAVRKHRITITNAQAHPELPRALVLYGDPHDPLRPLMMDFLASYGIDTIFSLGVQDLRQMNELRRFNCFVLPRFINTDIFHDYGEPRVIPVGIPAAHLFPSFYRWRAQVTAEIHQYLPTLLYPHPGYSEGSENPFAVHGESYARMLSRNQFGIADTTVLDYQVSKHLEIPAVGSVLVAPDSQVLRDYGFRDLENCILGAAGVELYAKLRAVAAKPKIYERIRSKGHALVHSRYSYRAWPLILDWLDCRRNLKPGEKVQQKGLFGAFRAIPDAPHVPAIANFKVHDNPMGVRLRAAREALLNNGDLTVAAAGLQETMTWIGHIGEPWFMLGVISFAIGDLDSAAQLIGQRGALQHRSDASLGLLDPCEVAWLLLIAHLQGDQAAFAEMSRCAAATSHVSIRRVQWLIGGTPSVPDLSEAGLDGPKPGDCLSIHWLGDEDMDSWCALVIRGQQARSRLVAAKAA